MPGAIRWGATPRRPGAEKVVRCSKCPAPSASPSSDANSRAGALNGADSPTSFGHGEATNFPARHSSMSGDEDVLEPQRLEGPVMRCMDKTTVVDKPDCEPRPCSIRRACPGPCAYFPALRCRRRMTVCRLCQILNALCHLETQCVSSVVGRIRPAKIIAIDATSGSSASADPRPRSFPMGTFP